MRVTIAAVLALLVGIVVGGYQARSELAEVTAEFEQQDCEKSPIPAALVAGMLGARAARNQDNSQVSQDDVTDGLKNPTTGPSVEGRGSPAIALDINSEEGIDLDAIADIMTLRTEQSRDVLIEKTDPTAAQLEEFDAVIGDMNDALVQLAADLGSQARSGSATRSSALVLTSDALNIIIDADNQIYSVFDADQLAGLDDEVLDPFSYVESSVLDAFTAGLE
jgi:hypothetical protein